MKTLQLADRTITSRSAAFIMGIVNCTPDSFYSSSRETGDLALSLIDEGADILDLGGESSRPGARYISGEEEMDRLIPVIKKIRNHSDIPISIDTRKYSVFKACREEGADILNDISALEDDPQLGPYAASEKVPVILMHKRGNPFSMQDYTDYDDPFNEVNDYLESRIQYSKECGIDESRIILDPGIGFGKDLKTNVTLIKNCGKLCGGKYPVLMALSRKSCIGQMTGEDVDGRLYGTLAANIISVLNGAFMLRVHDVKPCRDTLSVLQSIEELK